MSVKISTNKLKIKSEAAFGNGYALMFSPTKMDFQKIFCKRLDSASGAAYFAIADIETQSHSMLC